MILKNVNFFVNYRLEHYDFEDSKVAPTHDQNISNIAQTKNMSFISFNWKIDFYYSRKNSCI